MEMKNYLVKWSYKRAIQLAVGFYFLYGFYDDGNFFFLLFGLMMSAQAILNVGCFSTKGCNATTSTETFTKEHPVVKDIKKID